MKAKAMSCGASMLVIMLLLFPTGAYAQFGDIFSAILSTITGPIGGALTDINEIRSSILKTEQQVLWPLSLITQAQNYISTIKASYRAWMNQVYRLPVNSANLEMPKSLESAFLSGQIWQIGSFGQRYTSTYGVQPASGAAPQLTLQMMDIEDAVAKDATVESMAADQATTTMLQTAQRIEDEAQTTAPGTADMVAAEARAAELASLAMQHKLLAYQLREAAIELGHRGSILKQSTTQHTESESTNSQPSWRRPMTTWQSFTSQAFCAQVRPGRGRSIDLEHRRCAARALTIRHRHRGDPCRAQGDQ